MEKSSPPPRGQAEGDRYKKRRQAPSPARLRINCRTLRVDTNKKTGGALCGAPPEIFQSKWLQRLDVRRLQALGAADDFEFDRLAVIQRLVAIRLDRGKMYEYIFPGLTLDEAKAFAGVEPLYCSLFFAHFVVLFSLKSYLVPR